MMGTRMRTLLLLTALFLVHGYAGCGSRTALVKDIRETRTAAYNQWVKMRETEDKSQVTISGKLRMEDAVKLAIRQNKPLQATLQEKEIARGKVIESYQAALPKVNATGTYTRPDEASSFDVGNVSVALGDVDN